jgi:hypothetical protein
MKKKERIGESAIDLLEEAVHLLRGAPLSVHAIYAAGVLPCAMGFLYFWADMSRGAYARDHANLAALGMALLFLWMKFWQSVYAAKLRALRFGQPDEPWTLRRIGWVVLQQTAVQPSALFLLPVAYGIVLPAPWLTAFYQNVTSFGSDPDGIRSLCAKASKQASIRYGQNNLLMGLLSIFGVFVWLNVAIAMALLPHLLKTLLGVETAFTQAGMASVFNTTYLACSFALTYVFIDPLTKAAYMLRCFYSQSLQTGEDLKSDLKRVRTAMSLAAALALLFAAGKIAAAPQTQTSSAPPAVSSTDLDHSIDDVMQRPEFAWRMPREEAKDDDTSQKTWYGRALASVVNMMRDVASYCMKSAGESIKWIFDQLKKLWPSPSSSDVNPAGMISAWTSFLRVMLVILIIAIAAILAVAIVRLWQNRRLPNVVVATPVAARPDLNDENVAADQLPEEGWLKMARDLMAEGNLRLALRAFYLAGLASLAARELIAIAKFKSNREYEMELRRRARALPAVQAAFSQNVAAFDRAWYGLHEVTLEALQQFQSNLEQIRS